MTQETQETQGMQRAGSPVELFVSHFDREFDGVDAESRAFRATCRKYADKSGTTYQRARWLGCATSWALAAIASGDWRGDETLDCIAENWRIEGHVGRTHFALWRAALLAVLAEPRTFRRIERRFGVSNMAAA